MSEKSAAARMFPRFALYREGRGAAIPRPLPSFTAAEQAQSCWENMQTAARELSEVRGLWDRAQPGDANLVTLRGELSRLTAEQRHWKEYHDHFAAKARAAAHDPRLPREREPGDDT